ncbi:MAG: ATP-binding cassette domain-containing protein [Candidatus Pelagibacter sp.]
MLSNIFKLISKYSNKKKFIILIILLFVSTILQYLLYLTLPILAFQLTSISLETTNFSLDNISNIDLLGLNIKFSLEKILYASIFLAISANLFSIYFIKDSAYFSFKLSSDIQINIFRNYLFKKYSYFLNHTKSESLNNIITDMFRLPAGIFIPFFQFISSIILAVLLILTLFIVNFKVSMIVLSILSATYLLVFRYFKKKLYQTSVDISSSHKKIYEIVSYSLGLNKDVKLYNLEKYINEKFTSMSKILINTRTFANFISTSPKYIVEAITIFFSILAVIFLYRNNLFNQETILFFMFFGILSVKIIPALQSIYVSLSAMQSNKSLIDTLPSINLKNSEKNTKNYFNFKKKLQLKKISFNYDSSANVISNLNLNIHKGEKISIIGSNGSGKTTLINIISGLLKPSNGKIFIDGKNIEKKNYFKLFSILDPNPIFMNASIYENICFKEKINFNEKKNIDKILSIVEIGDKHKKNLLQII